MKNVKLLDCTLRDGGYLNDWKFGNDNIVNIFERLIASKVDIVEIGFLNEKREFDSDRTIMPDSKSVASIYGKLDKSSSMVVAMIDYGTCAIEQLEDCKDSYLDGIRVIFKEQKMYEAIDFCKEVKKKGYKVFVQAVSITTYTDEKLLELIQLVNNLEPYSFSMVDTYGLLYQKELMHIFHIVEENLLQTIMIGYHAHNNFQLAYANCIAMLNEESKHGILLDGTLYGMGKSAGNAPIELLAMYLNENFEKKYKQSQLLEAIDTVILDIRKEISWGYSYLFFLAASHACHPNYVNYLLEKKKLSAKSIKMILQMIEPKRRLLYDKDYIENLYQEYQNKEFNDDEDRIRLAKEFEGKVILLLAPGKKIIDESDKVHQYIEKNRPVVIAINFLPKEYQVDYVFMSNAKRYVQMSTNLSLLRNQISIIATSNVTSAQDEFNFMLNYSSLLDETAMIVDNPMIMLLKILVGCEVREVALAGFDGYDRAEEVNYINPNMEHSFSREKAELINQDVIESLERMKEKPKMIYVTASLYQR